MYIRNLLCVHLYTQNQKEEKIRELEKILEASKTAHQEEVVSKSKSVFMIIITQRQHHTCFKDFALLA